MYYGEFENSQKLDQSNQTMGEWQLTITKLLSKCVRWINEQLQKTSGAELRVDGTPLEFLIYCSISKRFAVSLWSSLQDQVYFTGGGAAGGL